jgi:hypothetical protein
MVQMLEMVNFIGLLTVAITVEAVFESLPLRHYKLKSYSRNAVALFLFHRLHV